MAGPPGVPLSPLPTLVLAHIPAMPIAVVSGHQSSSPATLRHLCPLADPEPWLEAPVLLQPSAGISGSCLPPSGPRAAPAWLQGPPRQHPGKPALARPSTAAPACPGTQAASPARARWLRAPCPGSPQCWRPSGPVEKRVDCPLRQVQRPGACLLFPKGVSLLGGGVPIASQGSQGFCFCLRVEFERSHNVSLRICVLLR